MVTLVAFTRLGIGFCLGSPISGQRSADIDRLLESSLFITPDVTFVASRIDELSFGHRHISIRFSV